MRAPRLAGARVGAFWRLGDLAWITRVDSPSRQRWRPPAYQEPIRTPPYPSLRLYRRKESIALADKLRVTKNHFLYPWPSSVQPLCDGAADTCMRSVKLLSNRRL